MSLFDDPVAVALIAATFGAWGFVVARAAAKVSRRRVARVLDDQDVCDVCSEVADQLGPYGHYGDVCDSCDTVLRRLDQAAIDFNRQADDQAIRLANDADGVLREFDTNRRKDGA